MYEITREKSPHTRFSNIWDIAQQGQSHPDALSNDYKYQIGTIEDHDGVRIGVLISSYEDPYVEGSLPGRDRIVRLDFETGHSITMNETTAALAPDEVELLERLGTFELAMDSFEPNTE